MSASNETCQFFFEKGDDHRFKCKHCGNHQKQAPSTGYSNLMSVEDSAEFAVTKL